MYNLMYTIIAQYYLNKRFEINHIPLARSPLYIIQQGCCLTSSASRDVQPINIC